MDRGVERTPSSGPRAEEVEVEKWGDFKECML